MRAIRTKLGMSQAEFAAAFGLSLSTLRKCEQEGREPEGPARAYRHLVGINGVERGKRLG